MRTDELPQGHGSVSIEAPDEATVTAIEELLRLHFRAGPAVRYSEYHAIAVPHRAVHHLTLTVDTRIPGSPEPVSDEDALRSRPGDGLHSGGG